MIKRGIFKANDIRGITEGPDPEWDAAGAYAIGAAAVDVLDLKSAEALVVGRDMRISGPQMVGAFIDGVLSRGVDVIDIGLSSTDQLWFASGWLDLPGAMFTASHNPAAYNGIKFCLAGAKPITSVSLIEIADRASGPEPAPAATRGTRTERDVLSAYADHLHSLVNISGLRRLRVVADAGNGMAGYTLPAVLDRDDLELIGLFTELDGSFPNHPPNPLEPENLLDAQAAVRDYGADLALVFDGDADRCFIIDERGDVINPSVVTAMIATQELGREPGATIVCNKITSRVVAEVVQAEGGKIVITKVGHTFVKAAMAEHNAIFGGETLGALLLSRLLGSRYGNAGRAACTGRGGPFGPAALGAGGSFREVRRLWRDQQPSWGSANDHGPGGRRVRRPRGARSADGLTVAGPDWWVNVRPSNTEPLLRLNVEAADQQTMEALRDETLGLIRP
jgi:phosphomannomutase